MKLFGRYLFAQAAGALLLILLSLTGVVWIATALKQLNVVTSQGQEAWQFIKMTLLAVPNLMAIIAPVALLIASLHTLNRLNGDSELIVMTASGASVWYFARPLILLSLLVSATVLVFNLYVMPWSARTLAEMFTRMRTDLIGQVLQPGRFSSPEPNLTFHIRDRDPRTGRIAGLVMHDSRDPAQPSTYLAERGDILKNGADAFLVMHEGHIIRQDQGDPQQTQIIQFDRYVIDLVRFKPKGEAAELRPRERYLSELWTLDAKDLQQPPQIQGKLRGELHERLASPLYPIAFVMIVLAGVGVAQTTRQNRARSIVTAFASATALRIGGFAALNVVTLKPGAAVLLYVIPLSGIVAGGIVAALRMRPRPPSRLARALSEAAWMERLAGFGQRLASGLRRRPAGSVGQA